MKHVRTVVSPANLVTLARRIIEHFPEYYAYFAEEEFEWDGVKQRNRNPLLSLGIGTP